MPRRDPLVDTGPHGLRGFNLGTIPASVTPPRTWRRAAWFMIFSSAAALMALLFVATTLVRPRPMADRIPTLPDLPTGPELIVPTPRPTGPDAEQPTGYPHSTADQHLVPAGGPTGPGNAPAGLPRAAGGPAGPSGGAPATGPGTGIVPNPGSPPSATAGSAAGPPSADPGSLEQRTQAFFRDVTTNAQAAAALTADTVRDDATALINSRYSRIATIQVQRISLDPTSGVTVSVLKVTNRDGTTSTEQTTLHFTLGGDPEIENPGG